MPFITGAQSPSTTPALDFMTMLDGVLTANGYVFVEQVIPTATDTTRVYRSPAASNSAGVDWFLYVRRTTDAATAVVLTVSEAWDATAKRIQKYVPSNAAPVSATTYNTTDTTGVLVNGTLLGGSLTGLSTTQTYQYWISVTPTRLIIAGRAVGSTSDVGLYFGLMDEVMPNTVPGSGLSLGILTMSMQASAAGANNTNGGGGTTREPGASGSVWFGQVIGAPWGFSSSATDLYSGRAYASRMVALPTRTGGASSPRALPKDVIGASTIGAINGDTLTINGVSYVRMNQGGTTSLQSMYVDSSI